MSGPVISAPEILDALPVGVVVVDASMQVSMVNLITARWAGCRPAELAGRPCRELLEWRDVRGERSAGHRWPAPTRLAGTRTIAAQSAVLTGPGPRRVTVTVAGTYLRDASGGVGGAVLTLTAPPRSGRDAPVGVEVVSTVSHELRAPLTSVKGYTSLMLNRWDRLSDEQKQKMLAQVNHDADRVTRLITELLDISRLETGRLTLRRQMVDLAALAVTVIDKVRLEYPELDAAVAFPGPFPQVYADPDKVEQVLTNLVENACKYASPKGMVVAGTVGVDTVSVAVSDRGEGIPDSDLPKVFTRFFRRSEGRPTGSGLGLWISRGLVESHGGELTADSKAGHGSTFRFTLPLIDFDQLNYD